MPIWGHNATLPEPLASQLVSIIPAGELGGYLHIAHFVSAVDDVAVVGLVENGLCAEFAAEELGDLAGVAIERLSHVGNVGQHCLDAVPAAFDLGLDARHLVAVRDVLDWRGPANVDHLGRARSRLPSTRHA
eukprot:scaffold990_cov279-Pinguiococcus_pyrenoidosus.AAC.1